MSFRHRDFDQRLAAMGDEAEGIFEDVYPQAWDRFGLCRPRSPMANMPPFVRYAPDYITGKGWVEVQGFGRDQTAKFKRDKIEALLDWNHRWRVDLFMWDSHNKRYGWVRLQELVYGLHTSHIKQFPEGTPYFEVPATELPVIGWVNHGGKLGVER